LVTGISGRALLFVSVSFVTIVGFLAFPHTPDRNFTFWPPVFWIVVFIIEIAAAYGLAWLWGSGRLEDAFRVRNLRVPHWLLGFIIFAVTAFFFIGMNIAPSILPTQPLAGIILSYALLAIVLASIVTLFFRNTAITWSHHLAAVWGALLFFALLGPLQELDASRSDDTSGMAIVGLGVVLFLVLLTISVRSAHRRSSYAN
jgi:hypothetical protein